MANLQPSRTAWRKFRKGKVKGNATSCNTLAFGDFGIQSLDRGRIPANQIEAARVAISRALKRKGKLWMRVFPHRPVTKKPAEVRMGSGKGGVEYYVAVIKPGTMMFEVGRAHRCGPRGHAPSRHQAAGPQPLRGPRGARKVLITRAPIPHKPTLFHVKVHPWQDLPRRRPAPPRA